MKTEGSDIYFCEDKKHVIAIEKQGYSIPGENV
jgi:hypothetical protein